MITEIKSPTETTYFIAHDSKPGGVCHQGVIDKGLVVATGQPELEQFTDEKKFLERLSKWRDVTDTTFKLQLAQSVAWVKDVAKKTKIAR
jgi:hypothetical protein